MTITRSRLIITAALVALTGALALTGCRSMDKETVRAKLESLATNRPLAALGLEARELSFDLGKGPEPLELIYAHVPAREPRPGAAPVVLVHGTPGTLYMWTEVMLGTKSAPGLALHLDVYAIEVLGHGFAPGDAEPLTFQRAADFVAAAVEALDLPPAHLVGHSYGGEFAWRAALDRPDLFRSLTLTSSSGYARTEEQFFPEEIEMRENSLADVGWWINSRDRVRTALTPHFDQLTEDRVDEFFLTCENAVNWRSMVDLCQDENGERAAELPQLELPVLLLWGARDLAFPVEPFAKRFLNDLPHAELVTLDAGHYPAEERSAEYAAALEAFIDRVEGEQP